MTENLLSTKLTIPPIRQNIITRQRLIDRLNAGLICPLALVSSPPGFGKTTILSAWAQQTEVPVAWLTLERDDNDITRFIQYFYAAARSLEPGLPELQVGLLKSSKWMISTLVPLINTLNQKSTSFALVLDDYHEIDAPAVHEAITYLLEHMPEQMHLIIASRADPPLPLARLRARGQLNEIRAADLRFNREEIADFNRHIMNLDLRSEDVTALEIHTEGWIAGLQLAALSMQGKTDLQEFIAGFTGSHEYIVDYLTDEVLNQQSEMVQNFLLRTSLLSRLTSSLCDAVTGESHGQQMLEYLSKANLFVSNLDNQRQWYRYHRLFADVLRQRLMQADPNALSTLHARASDWYAAHDAYADAIEHAFAGGHYERATALIDKVAESMLMRSEVTTLLRWIDRIPTEIFNTRPVLSLFFAWAALMEGYALEKVESHLTSVVGLDMGKADSFRAFASLFQGRIAEAQQLASYALTHITEDERFLMSATTWILNLSEIMNADLRSSSQQLEDIVNLTRAAGNVMMTMMTMCNIGEMTMRQGQLHNARTIYERVITTAVDTNGQPLPISGMAFLGLAELAREWGQFDEAKCYVEKGMQLAAAYSTASSIEAHIQLARILQSQNEYEKAQSVYEKAAELATAYKTSELDDQFVELLATRLWIVQGQLEDAEQWVIRRGLDTMDSNLITSYYDYHVFHHEYLTVARLRLAQKRCPEALVILNDLLALMDKWGWLQSRREIELHVVRAVVLQSLNKYEQALSSLVSALEIAERGGYVQTFIEEGPVIAELLARIVSKGIMPEYAGKLLNACGQVGTSSSHTGDDLIDPLSQRELEVLRLIAAGLSNPEIAGHLVVAVGTIKAHTSSIYSKLGVNNRVQAVKRARELNLL